MKKVFVSIPLKGRSKEQIQDSLDKIKGAVEGLLDGEVEILHQEVKDLPDFDKDEAEDSLEFLGKDLELMADADYFATIDCNWEYRHCTLEEDIFRRYKCIGKSYEERENNMFRFSLNIIAPDVVKAEKEAAEKLFKMDFPEEVKSERDELFAEQESKD